MRKSTLFTKCQFIFLSGHVKGNKCIDRFVLVNHFCPTLHCQSSVPYTPPPVYSDWVPQEPVFLLWADSVRLTKYENFTKYIHWPHISLTSDSALAFSMKTALQSVRSSYISPAKLLHLRFGNWAKLKNISTGVTHNKYLQKYSFLSFTKLDVLTKWEAILSPLKRFYSYVFLLNNCMCMKEKAAPELMLFLLAQKYRLH